MNPEQKRLTERLLEVPQMRAGGAGNRTHLSRNPP